MNFRRMVLTWNLRAFVPCAPQSILKKFTELCNNSLRCQNNFPKSTESWDFSVLCLYLSVLYSVALAVKAPWLIHTPRTFKVAGRIWGHVHRVERVHKPVWEVVHHLMDSLPEEKQIKNLVALGVRKAVSILSGMKALF